MSTTLGGGTKDLKHAQRTKAGVRVPCTDLPCSTAVSQEVSSHTRKTLACGHQL